MVGKNLNKVLSNHYYNPKNAGAFSGLSTFQKYIKSKKLKIKPEEIKDWLEEQETYTLHKARRKYFPRNKIIVQGIDDTWQADLIDVANIASHNQNFKFILTVIDVFSKYAWVVPLKNKTNETLINAFNSIFESSKRIPKRLHTDEGKEFIGTACQKFLEKNGIQFYTLNSEMKASIVERFNRTLKEKMWRYFTRTNQYVFYKVLDDLVNSYNHSYHRSIKMRPIDVNKSNRDTVFFNLYGIDQESVLKNEREINIRFKKGDQVRISKSKQLFEKGYTPNWTREIFTIDKVIIKDIPVYKIVDYSGEEIKGVFYDHELQKVTKSDGEYLVEKVLNTRKTKDGKTQYFVKWMGYPSSFNSWVSNLFEIEK